MSSSSYLVLIMQLLCVIGCSAEHSPVTTLEPFGTGPYKVTSTNMEVAPEFVDIGDKAMDDYLVGRADDDGQPRFVTEILKYPESAWIVDVEIPKEISLYGPASGLTMPVAVYVSYPSGDRDTPDSYVFPYLNAKYGEFADMLGPGESPSLDHTDLRYPLVILAHGSNAHGLLDVNHAQKLASHGYIVAVITYGDDRTRIPDSPNHHILFLRALLTSAVLDSILASSEFGAHIDSNSIGISGHSLGGFTVLASAGGPVFGNPASVRDTRISAGVAGAPWVGGHYEGENVYAFGPENKLLSQVMVPVLCVFSTRDELVQSSFILQGMRRLSGPTYVVEAIDQPHFFEAGSWEDRDNWELLFFSAYLKKDSKSLELMKKAYSMNGGNEDVQLFEYQSPGVDKWQRNPVQ